jgi:hypothetical protein
MKTDRRAFLEGLAVAPLAPAAFASPAVPEPPPAGAAAMAGPEAVAETLAEAVKRQYGAHLDADELQAVRKRILRNLERADRLRKAAGLGNADEPVTRFEAVPKATKGAER